MAQLYANENIAMPVVQALREMGHDVLTTHDAGKGNQAIPDEHVLQYASSTKRVVLTHNHKDFWKLRNTPGHAGIISATADVDHSALAQRVHRKLEQVKQLEGQFVRITRQAQPAIK